MKTRTKINILVVSILLISNFSIPIQTVAENTLEKTNTKESEINQEPPEIPSSDSETPVSESEESTEPSETNNQTLDSEESTVPSEPVIPDSESEDSSIEPNIESTKKWGDVNWSFDESTGILTFLDGESLGESVTSPWNREDYLKIPSNKIEKIIFTSDVKAPHLSKYLFSSQYSENNYLTNLKQIDDFSNLNMPEETAIPNMFLGCTSLESIDLSNFNSHNKIVDNMFDKCIALNTIILGQKSIFNMDPKLPDIPTNEKYTGSWIKQDEPSINMGSSSNFIQTYDGSAPGTYVWEEKLPRWGDVDWSFDNQTGTLTFLEGKVLGDYNTSPWNTKEYSRIPADQIKKIRFTSNVDAPVNSEYLFSDKYTTGLLTELVEIEGLEKVSMSKVTSMRNMFDTCSSLTRLDLNHFNTSNVTNLTMMFHNCFSLTTLDLSTFNTSKVIDSSYIFMNCNKLDNLKLGPNSVFSNGDTALPAIPKDSSRFSGNWIYSNLNNETVGTSDQFLSNYDGSRPGTYKWELTVDNLNPNDPWQQSLSLNEVPAAYNFKAKIQQEKYSLNVQPDEQNKISVYNSRLDRSWYVRASVKNNELSLARNPSKKYAVTSFTINNNELVGVGKDGKIVISDPDKTLENNVGDLTENIEDVSLSFEDKENLLKVNDALNGVVQYQLYNIAEAE